MYIFRNIKQLARVCVCVCVFVERKYVEYKYRITIALYIELVSNKRNVYVI
jgi:hypothetical protein